jgi:hypothetical protein
MSLVRGCIRVEWDIPASLDPRRAKMTSARAALFRTVPEKDYLGFWAEQGLKTEEVGDFLELKKADVTKLADV